MNSEILLITGQLKESYEGDPWFGRNAKTLLSEVNEGNAFEKPNAQHSILDLVWHMITWREFTLGGLKVDTGKDLHYFEKMDWRELDHTDKKLLQQGLERFHQIQNQLVEAISEQTDELLNKTVSGRQYDFRKLLHGIIQHDIYHLGQIAYLIKLLKKQ